MPCGLTIIFVKNGRANKIRLTGSITAINKKIPKYSKILAPEKIVGALKIIVAITISNKKPPIEI